MNQENYIFIANNEKRFNTNNFSPALLISKKDSLDKQFNNIMEFFKIGKQATLEDIANMKGKGKEEDSDE